MDCRAVIALARQTNKPAQMLDAVVYLLQAKLRIHTNKLVASITDSALVSLVDAIKMPFDG